MVPSELLCALAGALLRSTTTVSNGGGTVSVTTVPADTLIVYVYSDTDPGAPYWRCVLAQCRVRTRSAGV